MKEKKVISIEERIPTLRKRRKKKANRQLIIYLLLFFLMICAIIYLQSPLSNIKNVSIAGNNYLTDDEVMQDLSLHEPTNFWKFKKRNAEQKLQENDFIKKAQVKKKFPGHIEITVQENKKLGYLLEDDHYSLVLEDGSILSEERPMSDAPLLVGIIEEKHVNRLTKELSKLPQSVLNLISEIHWQSTEDSMNTIDLYMNDGYLVKANIRNFSKNMRFYPSIVMQLSETEQGIIHIGVGAYFEEIYNETEE